MNHAPPIRGHEPLRNRVGTGFVEGFDGHFLNADFHPNTGGHEPAVKLQGVEHAAAYGAPANHTEVRLLHEGQSMQKAGWVPQFKKRAASPRGRSRLCLETCYLSSIQLVSRSNHNRTNSQHLEQFTPVTVQRMFYEDWTPYSGPLRRFNQKSKIRYPNSSLQAF